MARLRARRAALLWACALAVPLVACVSIIHDETAWTKRAWDAHKVEPGLWAAMNPSDDAITPLDVLADVKRTTYNSLDGPTPRRSPSQSAL